MKKLILCSVLTATLVLQTPARAEVVVGATATVTGVTSAVTASAATIAASVFLVDVFCTSDKKHSCSKGAKRAGQDLIDYARGKKNGFKAIARLGQRVFGW